MNGYTSTFGLIRDLEEISINTFAPVDERRESTMVTKIPEAGYLIVVALRNDPRLSIKELVLAIGRLIRLLAKITEERLSPPLSVKHFIPVSVMSPLESLRWLPGLLSVCLNL